MFANSSSARIGPTHSPKTPGGGNSKSKSFTGFSVSIREPALSDAEITARGCIIETAVQRGHSIEAVFRRSIAVCLASEIESRDWARLIMVTPSLYAYLQAAIGNLTAFFALLALDPTEVVKRLSSLAPNAMSLRAVGSETCWDANLTIDHKHHTVCLEALAQWPAYVRANLDVYLEFYLSGTMKRCHVLVLCRTPSAGCLLTQPTFWVILLQRLSHPSGQRVVKGWETRLINLLRVISLTRSLGRQAHGKVYAAVCRAILTLPAKACIDVADLLWYPPGVRGLGSAEFVRLALDVGTHPVSPRSKTVLRVLCLTTLSFGGNDPSILPDLFSKNGRVEAARIVCDILVLAEASTFVLGDKETI